MSLHRAVDELPPVTVIEMNAMERSHETPLICLKIFFLSQSEPLCYCRKIDENPPHLLDSLTQII